jgi:RNA polymerase sigma factor (sigma-70 family)
MQNEFNKDYFLWKRFKGGDNKAFYELYDEHIDSLYSFGMQFSRDTDFVKDCIHDLFLDLHKYKDQLSDTNSIRFYLFRSLRRIIHKQQSKQSFLKLAIDKGSDQANQAPAFEDILINSEIQKETFDLLVFAVSQLTEQQQRALFLKFEQNLTYPEIASLLGISVESARTNIYRALKTLREKMPKVKISVNLLFHLIPKCHLVF